MQHAIQQKRTSYLDEKKGVMLFFLLTIAMIFGGYLLTTNAPSSSQITVSANAKVAVENDTFDWGNIPLNGGNVTKEFTLKNTGTEVVQLTNVKTSCHCTVATITTNNETSPAFGMSGKSLWIGELQPGKTATLTVIFDPAYHGPQGTGPINRFVSIETNASTNRKLLFSLTGVVVN